MLVHQHHDGDVGVGGLVVGLVDVVHIGDLALGLHDLDVLAHEDVDDVDGLAQETAAVVAQVDDEILHPLLLELLEGVIDLAAGLVQELVELDVAHLVAEQPRPRDVGLFHLLAFHLEGQVLAFGRAIDLHRVGAAGLSAHGEVDGVDVAVRRRLSVDA